MRSMISAAVFATIAVGGMGAAHAQYAGQPVRAAYTVEPYTPASAITIQGTGVRLRAEPFTLDTPVLSHGSTGLPLTVVGIARMPEWNWYQVILRSGQRAFIRSDYTSAPSKGGAAAPTPALQAPAAQAPPTQLAAPLPPPSRIDYGAAPAPSPAFNPPASVSAPVSLTPAPAPLAPAPIAAPAPARAPARAYGAPPMSPAPIPAAPTPPAQGSPISLLPTSPMPGSAPASSNADGLSSVDPNVFPR